MKKRYIKLISFLFISLHILLAQLSAQELRIDVQVERVGNIELLPIYLHITLWNVSSKGILLPKDINKDEGTEDEGYFKLATDGSTKTDVQCWFKNGPTHQIGSYPKNYSPFFDLAPGKSYSLTKDASKEAGIMHPGIYKVKVVWDSRKIMGGYKGYAESNWIDIKIDEATGADKNFLDEQKKLVSKRFNCSILDGSIFESVILHNMNSIYAGWSMLQIVGNPIIYTHFQNNYDQEKALQYIDLSVNNPVFGYVSVANGSPENDKLEPIFQNSGEGTRQLARWKIEKGHAIVALHPDFKYVDNIKIMIALNHLALGENQEGLNELHNLVEKGNPEVSQWASKFLELWQSKHPSPKANKK